MKLKNLFAGILAIAMVAVACEDPNADPQNPNPDQDPGTTPDEELVVGDGTEANPWRLRTVADLQSMAEKAPFNEETYFRLENDIDMSEVTNWVPVNYADPFTRIIHFDGNNKTISNFSPDTWLDNEVATGYPSFFGVLVGSCKDLTISNAEILEATNTTGILAGYVGTSANPITSRFTTNVSNVSVSGNIETSSNKAGGMAGACFNANFENCKSDVSLRTASSDAGGFVGQPDAKGKNNFKNCSAKVALTSIMGDKCRCGGFIGWNRAAETVIENCHVLSGSTITDESERTTKQMPMFGGFIAFADNDPGENEVNGVSVLTVKNSSSDIIIDAGPLSRVNSLFIAQSGYKSTITLENCTAKGKVISKDNYAGGFLGLRTAQSTGTITITGCTCEGEVSAGYGAGGIVGGIEGGTLIISNSKVKATVTSGANDTGGILGKGGAAFSITGCSFDGTVTAAGYVGGIVGGIKNFPCTISRSYAKGSLTGSSNYIGGLVGAAQSDNLAISDCYSTMSVTQNNTSGLKQVGGLVGTATNPIEITNCFASGDVKGVTVAAGLVGRIGAAESTVSKCISWNSNVEAFTSSLSGAIIGSLEMSGTYSDCVRKSDMVVKVEGTAQTLTDQDNITTVSAKCSYNGKAAAAGATLSSVAQSLGWSTDIWDFSAAVPTLK